MNVLSCGPKASKISGLSDSISSYYIRKNPRSMYARVPHGLAQFVLKIEKLSHIIGTASVLEMARAYGLRPLLRLLLTFNKLTSVFYASVLLLMINCVITLLKWLWLVVPQ